MFQSQPGSSPKMADVKGKPGGDFSININSVNSHYNVRQFENLNGFFTFESDPKPEAISCYPGVNNTASDT